jgi:hypothetical protein
MLQWTWVPFSLGPSSPCFLACLILNINSLQSFVTSESLIFVWPCIIDTNNIDNQLNATITVHLIFQSVRHVSGDDFDHLQEPYSVFAACGIMHPRCCRPVVWKQRFLHFQTTGWQHRGSTIPQTVNTVSCSWRWVKSSPETCWADWNYQ